MAMAVCLYPQVEFLNDLVRQKLGSEVMYDACAHEDEYHAIVYIHCIGVFAHGKCKDPAEARTQAVTEMLNYLIKQGVLDQTSQQDLHQVLKLQRKQQCKAIGKPADCTAKDSDDFQDAFWLRSQPKLQLFQGTGKPCSNSGKEVSCKNLNGMYGSMDGGTAKDSDDIKAAFSILRPPLEPQSFQGTGNHQVLKLQENQHCKAIGKPTDFIGGDQKQPGGVQQCGKCGRDHQGRSCPAREKECFRCQTKGHFANMCFCKQTVYFVNKCFTKQTEVSGELAVGHVTKNGRKLMGNYEPGYCAVLDTTKSKHQTKVQPPSDGGKCDKDGFVGNINGETNCRLAVNDCMVSNISSNGDGKYKSGNKEDGVSQSFQGRPTDNPCSNSGKEITSKDLRRWSMDGVTAKDFDDFKDTFWLRAPPKLQLFQGTGKSCSNSGKGVSCKDLMSGSMDVVTTKESDVFKDEFCFLRPPLDHQSFQGTGNPCTNSGKQVTSKDLNGISGSIAIITAKNSDDFKAEFCFLRPPLEQQSFQGTGNPCTNSGKQVTSKDLNGMYGESILVDVGSQLGHTSSKRGPPHGIRNQHEVNSTTRFRNKAATPRTRCCVTFNGDCCDSTSCAGRSCRFGY